MTSIKAYHGGSERSGGTGLDRAAWFSTDRDHAAYFGPVSAVELTSSVEPLRISAEQAEEIMGAGGYAADARLWALLEERDAAWAWIEGWEGAGMCVVVRESHLVDVTEVA